MVHDMTKLRTIKPKSQFTIRGNMLSNDTLVTFLQSHMTEHHRFKSIVLKGLFISVSWGKWFVILEEMEKAINLQLARIILYSRTDNPCNLQVHSFLRFPKDHRPFSCNNENEQPLLKWPVQTQLFQLGWTSGMVCHVCAVTVTLVVTFSGRSNCREPSYRSDLPGHRIWPLVTFSFGGI